MGTILLYENDADVREVLRELFENDGDEVVIVESCAEAVGLSRTTRLDLAVIDVGPEDGGLATIVALHEDQRVPTIALYAMSHSCGNDVGQMARQVGAARTFKKPFDFSDFRAAAREIRASPTAAPPADWPAPRRGPRARREDS